MTLSRFIIYLLLICASINSSHSFASSIPENHSLLVGEFNQGMKYMLVSFDQTQSGIVVRISSQALPFKEENALIFELVQRALFKGAKDLTVTEITDVLSALSLNVDLDGNVRYNELSQSLQFSLLDQNVNGLIQLVDLLDKIVSSPTLTDEGVELARNYLLENMNLTVEQKLMLTTITTQEVREFYSFWYVPQKMCLEVIGYADTATVLNAISSVFGGIKQELIEGNKLSVVPVEEAQIANPIPVLAIEQPVQAQILVSTEEQPNVIQKPSESELVQPNQNQINSERLTPSMAYLKDTDTYVIDEKIFMNAPERWSEYNSNGRLFGAALIGTAALAFFGWWALPLLAAHLPVAAFFGLTAVTFATGGHFYLSTNYVNDPYYIEQIRQNDLRSGFVAAYRKGRAQYTLTPKEQRSLFMREMTEQPTRLKELPIIILTDVCPLNDPIVSSLFTIDEQASLLVIQKECIRNRNIYKSSKQALEIELEQRMATYTFSKNLALLNVETIYNNNIYVQTKKNLKTNLDANIEKTHNERNLTQQEKDAYIMQATAIYEANISRPDFMANLQMAENLHQQGCNQILIAYEQNKMICKLQMNYDLRLFVLNQGMDSVTNYYNKQLMDVLYSMPWDSSSLSDIIDRRYKIEETK